MILSYDAIVNHCIKNVIALPAVASIIEEIKDTIMRYNVEITSKVTVIIWLYIWSLFYYKYLFKFQEVEIPPVSDEYPWTYYELLKFFSETLFWPEELEVLVASAKSVYEILSTLSVSYIFVNKIYYIIKYYLFYLILGNFRNVKGGRYTTEQYVIADYC